MNFIFISFYTSVKEHRQLITIDFFIEYLKYSPEFTLTCIDKTNKINNFESDLKKVRNELKCNENQAAMKYHESELKLKRYHRDAPFHDYPLECFNLFWISTRCSKILIIFRFNCQ